MAGKPKTASLIKLRQHPMLPLAWRDVLAVLPPTYSQDGKMDEAVARIKFFDPCGSWTWYATEGTAFTADGTEVLLSEAPLRDDIEDVQFFGLVQGLEEELGYFSLRELASVDGRFKIGIERDIHFDPTPLHKVRITPLNKRSA